MDRNKSSCLLFIILLGFVGQLPAMFTAKLPYAINKRSEKRSPEVRKKIDEALQKAGEVYVQLYDPSSKNEYVLIKELWETSGLLKGLVESIEKPSQNDGPYLRVPFDYLFDMIPNLFELIRFYLETNEKERKDKLKEYIKPIDFKTLISISLLANRLLIQKDISDEIVDGVRNKIMSLNGINQPCFAELQKMDKALKKEILTDKVWDAFFQQMKIPIARYCFNKRFSSSISAPYIHKFSEDKPAEKLLLNDDCSRLLYIPFDLKTRIFSYPEQPSSHLLSVLNLQKPGVLDRQLIRQYPCWINKNKLVSLDVTEKNKFTLYDCETNITTKITVNPPQDKLHMSLYIYELIGSSDKQNEQKIILLYSLSSYEDQTAEYGLAFYNHESEKINHRELVISAEGIKLLFYSNELIRFLAFEKEMYGVNGYKISVHELSINNPDSVPLGTYKIKAIPAETKEKLFNCVVSPDGSKIAFADYQDICIQLLDTFSQPWIQLPGKKPISALVFSEDSQILMVGYEDGIIDAFDIDAGAKVGELSYTKKQAFKHNNALSFSSDGNTFAVSGTSFKDSTNPHDHLLIWKLMPGWQAFRDICIGLLNRLKDNLLLEKIVLCKFICDQSREEKKELKFSAQGKQEFNQLDYEFQEMFANTGYVASENLAILPTQQVSIPESIQQTQPSRPSFLESIKAAAIGYWQRLMGTPPSSSDVEKTSTIIQHPEMLKKLMSDKNRYVNE